MGGTPSIEIRTLQQTRAKAAPHVFRLPIVQGILRKAQAKAAGRPKSMLRDCSRKLNRSASVSKSCKRKH